VKAVTALLAMAAVLTAAALAVPAAQATPHHRLRLQLQQTRAELRTMRKKLSASRLRIQTLKTQASLLQLTLTQTQAQLAASQAQADALRAQLAAIPTPLSVAVQQVQHEVAWAEGGGPAYSHATLTALAAMDYVVGHVSVAEYGYLEVKGLPLPAHTPDAVLGAQAGLCGETSLAFAVILQRLGYQVRRVAFYWTFADGTPDGHTAAEVSYDGGWHYFDPTFGQYWTDASGNVLSITDARLGGGTRHKNDFTFTNLIEDPWFAGDDTSFETDPATTVVIGGDPFVG
jgi:Transglutaminase-like superfamily